MNTQYLQRMLIGLGLALAMATPCVSAPTNYYVVMSSQQPSPPTSLWTNWGLAHTNLFEVVAAARDNDIVYVTNNATYYLTNQITVSYAIKVRSWGPGGTSDPTNTILSGNYPTMTNRHFTLNNFGATLEGLTLTKGCASNGGSIYLQNGLVTNCAIVSNFAYNASSGGGVYMLTGSGGVWNCTISGNTASNAGGGIYSDSGGPWRIANCTISGNNVPGSTGGGIRAGSPTAVTTISNCWIVSNYSKDYAGGIYLGNSAECHNSFIMGNTVKLYEGGGVRIVGTALLRNCLVANNISQESTAESGGGVAALINPSIQNCTIVSNSAPSGGGGLYTRVATSQVRLENTIIWGNSGTYSNWYILQGTNTFTNCCTSPQIVSPSTAFNTITNDPKFVSIATADFRLQSDSPCINAGVNRAWMEGAQDLDGTRRIDNFRKTADIGAYEYLGRGTLFGFQ